MKPLPSRPRIPSSSLIFGYGPTLPLVAAAIGVWITASPSTGFVTTLAIIWGAIILVFVAGVRRGYGFGDRKASTVSELAAMIVYFVPGGVALVLSAIGEAGAALAVLVVGFVFVAILDRRAAAAGDAPAHFASLRGPQMTIMAFALAAVLARLLGH
jgi:hypothetical protein